MVSIAFRSKFCPVDFNLDFATCVTFCPSMTSDARLRPVFKASRRNVLAPLFNKGTPIGKDFRKYFLVHVLCDNVFQLTRDITFLPDSSSTHMMRSSVWIVSLLHSRYDSFLLLQ
jgi:hypothetical protein